MVMIEVTSRTTVYVFVWRFSPNFPQESSSLPMKVVKSSIYIQHLWYLTMLDPLIKCILLFCQVYFSIYTYSLVQIKMGSNALLSRYGVSNMNFLHCKCVLHKKCMFFLNYFLSK